jgi:hypothetical protein
MTKHNSAITAALTAAILITVSGCGNSHHQATPPTSTTSPTTTSTTTAPVTTNPDGTTTTTVLGPSGPPSSYPAAQATPPSLAGAYPTGTSINLVTVLKALTTYRDWVWSHPNPGLVANYELPSGNGYASDVKDLTEFQQEGIHADPTPSEILFVRVTLQAVPQPPSGGKPAQLNGYQWFRGGLVTAVYLVKPVLMLKANGQPSGQQFNPPTLGQVASSISLVQGSDGQFRFEDTDQLNPPGGIASVEQQA